MGFWIKKQTNDNRNSKKPFYKRKPWKVFFLFLGVVLIVAVSFFAYLYSTGSKIFDSDSSLIKAFLGGDNLKHERTNIVIMGRGGANHPGGLLTDSLMVISIDPDKKAMAMISIPRDLKVPIKNHGEDKINSAFSHGYSDYMQNDCTKKSTSLCVDEALSAGANSTKETVSNVLGIPVNYYATLDFNGFVKIIDEFDGVDVNVEQTIYDAAYPDEYMKGYDPFYIKSGEHHLDGQLALKYVRSRHTGAGDFDRAKRQQQVLVSLRQKATNLGFFTNPQKLINITNILGDNLRTDLTPVDLKSLVELVKTLDKDKVISKVFTSGANGELVNVNNGTYYLEPKDGTFDEIKQIAVNIFEEKIPENAKIEVLNGSSLAGSATKLSNILKQQDLNVINVANANTKYSKTTIYDYSSGNNPETIKKLEDGLGAIVIKKTTKPKSGADIAVVIGSDYNGFETN